ncbi:hypothetical protein ACIRL2_36670 [Embleya sp. NPDC127516]|uniref:hypothetical protein n=1 Tax=Embleya sp. NPDC127516 TaxID=3363990 RepID=UPI0038071052
MPRPGGPAAAREPFPLDGEMYLGTLVCRAYVEAAVGDWDAAVGLIASVIVFDPTTPWTPAAWPAATEPAQLLDPDALAEAVSRAIASLPDPTSEEQRFLLRPFEQLVRSVAARHPDHALLSVMTSALVRRMGDTAEAVRIAEHAHRIAPGYMPAVMLGNALRADGRPGRALAVWEAQPAREFDTHLAVDVAELYGATDRPAEGLNRLERVLATEPDHPTAAPARYGLRPRADGDIAHPLGLAAGFALVAVAWTHPDTRDDIGALVLERLVNIAESVRHREVTILRSIRALMLCCAWMDEHALRLARNLAERERREADETSDQDENEPSDEPDEGVRSPTDDRTAKAGAGTDDAAPVAPSASAAPPAGSRPGRFKRLFGRR